MVTPKSQSARGSRSRTWNNNTSPFQQKEYSRLLGRLREVAVREWKRGKCLHPSASDATCNRIIDAHTIPRASTLGPVADETSHLLTFRSFESWFKGHDGPWRVGWKKASTFRGFCARHDNEMFASLEKRPFARTPEQCFLLAFRGICYELFCKEWQLRTIAGWRQVISQTNEVPDADTVKEVLNDFALGVELGLRDLQHWKQRLDGELLNRQFAGWKHLGYTLEGEPIIAATGVITPEVDFNGNVLQSIGAFDEVLYPLVLSMLVSDHRLFHIVFSWPAEAVACEQYVKSLKRTMDDSSDPEVLVRLVFAAVENVYFSPGWWDKLDQQQMALLRSLAWSTEPNLGALPEPGVRLVEWQLVDTWSVGKD